MPIKRFVLAIGAGVLLCSQCPAHAASHCVGTTAQLATALFVAQNNGQADDIHLVVGTYLVSEETVLAYFAASGENQRLQISGGYEPGCTQYSTTDDTVLDGQDQGRIMTIDATGEVDINGITFQHANPALYCGGAVNLTNTDGNTNIYDNAFVANTDQQNCGGALFVSATATTSANTYVSIFNNLFIANTANDGGAAYLSVDNAIIYVTGNTIVANQGAANPAFAGGLDLAGTGTGHYYVSNNILWNNSGNDVYDQSGHIDYANNDIGTRDGFAPLSASNESSVDPEFDGVLSVRPKPTSPLVNAGLDTAPGGLGCCDLSGGVRLIGRHVDIGAYESDVLFRDGFGP